MCRTAIMQQFIMVILCDLAFDLHLYLLSMTLILWDLIIVPIDCVLTKLGLAESDNLVSVTNII